jgi:hypothetical protein
MNSRERAELVAMEISNLHQPLNATWANIIEVALTSYTAAALREKEQEIEVMKEKLAAGILDWGQLDELKRLREWADRMQGIDAVPVEAYTQMAKRAEAAEKEITQLRDTLNQERACHDYREYRLMMSAKLEAAEKRVSEAEALAAEVGKVADSIQANAKEDPGNLGMANWADRLHAALSAWEEGKK